MTRQTMIRIPLLALSILTVTSWLVLFSDIQPLNAACVCVCGNNQTNNTFTSASQCDQYCSAFKQCPPPNGACAMDTAKSTCDDVSPGGGGATPGGGSTGEVGCTRTGSDGVLYPCDPLQISGDPNKWITNAINVALGMIGAGAFLLMLYGGTIIMFARGDSKKVGEGRKIIVYAVIGLIVIMFSYVILNLVFSVIQEAVGS